MPELSRFPGTVIAMYYRDHGPPQFHALCGDFEATVKIATGELNGSLPNRALTHARDRRQLHLKELPSSWSLAQIQRPLPKIRPLE
jgi:Domain of unknown function (DUF4160)